MSNKLTSEEHNLLHILARRENEEVFKKKNWCDGWREYDGHCLICDLRNPLWGTEQWNDHGQQRLEQSKLKAFI